MNQFLSFKEILILSQNTVKNKQSLPPHCISYFILITIDLGASLQVSVCVLVSCKLYFCGVCTINLY